MRVAIVTESFLPQVNGVANTVRHVVEQLRPMGHEALVVAPGTGPTDHDGIPVVRVRSVGLPGYRSFPIGLPDAAVERALAEFAARRRPPRLPDRASAPPGCGPRAGSGSRPSRSTRPTSPASPGTTASAPTCCSTGGSGRLHRRADRTLVPSRPSYAQLERARRPRPPPLAPRRLARPLRPRAAASEELRTPLLGPGRGPEVVVGYVGRLAAEKQVRRLPRPRRAPRGPGWWWSATGRSGRGWAATSRAPTSPGCSAATHLATAFASLDVFVHPGASETFCQTVQEAQASGVPVVAAAAGGPARPRRARADGPAVRPRGPVSLWRAVAAVARDAPLRARLAAAAHAQVQGRTWPSLVEDLVEHHYRAVLARRRPAAA